MSNSWLLFLISVWSAYGESPILSSRVIGYRIRFIFRRRLEVRKGYFRDNRNSSLCSKSDSPPLQRPLPADRQSPLDRPQLRNIAPRAILYLALRHYNAGTMMSQPASPPKTSCSSAPTELSRTGCCGTDATGHGGQAPFKGERAFRERLYMQGIRGTRMDGDFPLGGYPGGHTEAASFPGYS